MDARHLRPDIGGVRPFLLTLALVLVPATAASAERSADTVFTFKASLGGRSFHDAAPAGDSKGDRYEVRVVLRNGVRQLGAPAGARVGRESITLVVADADGNARAWGVIELPGGTVRFRYPGLIASGSRVVVAPIEAGTGRFAGASGVVDSSVDGVQTVRLRA